MSGDRKIGRNKEVCKAYKASGREAINRKRRMRTKIRWQPNNIVLRERYESEFGKYEQDRKPNARIRRLVESQANP